MAVLAEKPGAEVLAKEPTLQELEAQIRIEHKACVGKLRATLEHALRAGDALLQIRERLMKTQEWSAWINGTDLISRQQAYTYMRLSTYRHLLPEDSTIRDGENFLKGLPALGTDKGRARLSDPIKADAKRMRGEGLGYKEIAKRLEVSPSTVYNWFNDSQKAHQRRASVALREKKRARAIKSAVAKTGGALAEAYSMAERMDDVLGQARREATDPEALKEIAKAHEYRNAMRDAIVRGLGVES